MTVRVYRSTDAGAPGMGLAAGRLVAVLDACLVQGYGSHPAAGWVKSHQATQRAMYRAPAGTGNTLFVDDTSADFCAVRGLTTPTGISDLTTGLWITGAINKGSDWLLVADERAFVLAVGRASWGPLKSVAVFGDAFPARAYDLPFSTVALLPVGRTATQLVGAAGSEELIVWSGAALASYPAQIAAVAAPDNLRANAALIGNAAADYLVNTADRHIPLIKPAITLAGVPLLAMPAYWHVQRAWLPPGAVYEVALYGTPRRFEIVHTQTGGFSNCFAIEISDTWGR